MKLQKSLLNQHSSRHTQYMAASKDQVALAVESNMNPTGSSGELKGRKKMDEYQSVQSLWDPSVGVKWSCCEYVLMAGAWLLMVIPIFWFFMFRTVRDYERALIFRLGKLKGGAEGPGVFLLFVTATQYIFVQYTAYDLYHQ